MTLERTAPPGNVSAKPNVPELALPSLASPPTGRPASGFPVEPSGADAESAPVSGSPRRPVDAGVDVTRRRHGVVVAAT